MALTGKTIGELSNLTGTTNNTLFLVEEMGTTYHIAYSGINYTELTYSGLTNLISEGQLSVGKYYLISDFRTCYDQPDYNNLKEPITTGNYKQSDVSPILVLATSVSTLALDAFQPEYPFDQIKYDVTYNITEVTSGEAFGRITERIDNLNNRTDYDHRTILFKRYIGYSYEENNSFSGLVGVSGITGTTAVLYGDTGTTFNSHISAGTIIAIETLDPKFFEVLSVEDDFHATISGVTIGETNGAKYYSADDNGRINYYKPNVQQNDVVEYTTFGDAIDNNTAVNNYVGNHANLHIQDNYGDFLLANNVFIDGEYLNNTIGDGSYNNTFNDDCTDNQIGSQFYNNSTNDDFDRNIIGVLFNNNYITSNFYDNRIGNDFEYNTLIGDDFYRNNIGNNFRYNVWSGNDDFQNNVIGNQFNNNKIYSEFLNNRIGNGYNNNEIYQYFGFNTIGNGFNDNDVYSSFSENTINAYCDSNTFGVENGYGSFYNNTIGLSCDSNIFTGTTSKNEIGDNLYSNEIGDNFERNKIGNDFENNTISNNFRYNQIGDQFQNNTIDDDFGFGGSQARGNVIGNGFQSNDIGEYFYDNTIGDNFIFNTIGDYFINNRISYSMYSCTIINIDDPSQGFQYNNITYGNFSENLTTELGNGGNPIFYSEISTNVVKDAADNIGYVTFLSGGTIVAEPIKVIVTQPFSVTANWSLTTPAVTDESSFTTFLQTTNGLTNVQITDFLLSGNTLTCNLYAEGSSLSLNSLEVTEVGSFGFINGLTTLNLNSNQIVTFDPSIPLPSSLQELGLSSNQIVTFDPSISLPSSLQYLYLSGNQIVTFDPSIPLPSLLQQLDLSSNQMTTSGYTGSEPWANAMSVIPSRGTISFNGNVDSVSGTNLETILIAKGWTENV
jgi:hypothetical protein